MRQADTAACETADGSADHPFCTINAAAQLAEPGDTVTVGPGIYHEWVSPARGGTPRAPILYRSLPEHAAIVRGTDVLDAQWDSVPDARGVFTTPLAQSAFIHGNPFAGAKETRRHALVFLNDQPLWQVTTREQLMQTTNSWLSSNDGQQLLVHLEGDSAPAKAAIEITTRDRVFAPHRRGLGYIEVEGFVFERCATRPGWPQLGALSTRTGNHWTIRSNIVRFTTGKGIDCGSETWSPELMLDTEKSDKRVMIGGHHLVASNVLTDNAECGIAAWNTDGVRIIGNIVSNNAAVGGEQPRPPNHLADAEAAGIKVHGFRDGVIEGNLVISNSSFGVWLDNGWEGARVTRNVSIGNRGAGIFVELGFGPVLVDHNLSAANSRLWPPYLGDGIYTHDASGITIAHNTLLENARYGLQEVVVSERVYWPKRMAEASHETMTGNLFFGNKIGAMFLPLLSPRSHDNLSDYNAIDPGESFGINNNSGRIPIEMILRECRDRIQAADIPTNQRPDLSDPKRLPSLSLPAWQVVMQMDKNSKSLPEQFRMHLDAHEDGLQIDFPSGVSIPTASPCPGDDFDLLGDPIKHSDTRAGAIEHLRPGMIRVWPLPLVARGNSR